MFWYWFGFSAFLVLIISGFFGLKMFNINLPKSLCVRYLIFSAFIDAFYISIVYSHLLCQFIFGGLCLLTIFMNLSINFVNSDKSQPIKRFDLLFNFLCGIGLTIYLLYIIPNESLQSIMIPVVSAVYGGLLTLIGVAWTIKWTQQQNNKKRKDEIKPNFFAVSEVRNSQNGLYTIKSFDCNKYKLSLEFFKNSEKSSFTLEGIIINNETFLCNCDKYVPKENSFKIYANGDDKNKIDSNNVYLIVKDIDGNTMKYKLVLDKYNVLQEVCFVNYIN